MATKFLLVFQPIYPLPLGHTRAGARVVFKGEGPPELALELAPRRYIEMYPADALFFQGPLKGTLGGFITYETEVKLLTEAATAQATDYVQGLLAEAVELPMPNLEDFQSSMAAMGGSKRGRISLPDPMTQRELLRGR